MTLNDLSQWRAYGGETAGYSIGFSRQHLVNLAAKNPAAILGPCIYDCTDKYRIIQQLVLLFSQEYQGSSENYHKELTICIRAIAPLFKHKAFTDEAEWRLVFPEYHSALKFRAGRTTPIPYIELNFENAEDKAKNGLEQIWIGPNPHMGRTLGDRSSSISLPREAVLDLLRQKGYSAELGDITREMTTSTFFEGMSDKKYDKSKSVRVVESNIPFRDY